MAKYKLSKDSPLSELEAARQSLREELGRLLNVTADKRDAYNSHKVKEYREKIDRVKGMIIAKLDEMSFE